MLNKNYGIINQFLSVFGIEPIAWLTDPNYFMLGMIIMIVWCNTEPHLKENSLKLLYHYFHQQLFIY